MAKLDWIIKKKIREGWSIREDGILLRPNGTPHYKKGHPSDSWRYRRINFGSEGQVYRVKYARLVCWLAHGAPPTPHHVVDHIDRNTLNDHPDNLRWATKSENAKNISEKAKQKRDDHIRKLNEQRLTDGAGNVKLSYYDAKIIRLKYSTDDVAQSELAIMYGVTPKTISSIVNNKSWVRKTFPNAA